MRHVSKNAHDFRFEFFLICITLVNDEIFWTDRCAREHALDKVLMHNAGLKLSFRQLFFRLNRNTS